MVIEKFLKEDYHAVHVGSLWDHEDLSRMYLRLNTGKRALIQDFHSQNILLSGVVEFDPSNVDFYFLKRKDSKVMFNVRDLMQLFVQAID